MVRFHNKRGTAEQGIKEGKQAVKMTRLSCHQFRANEVRLWLSLNAYNLGNLSRRPLVPVAWATSRSPACNKGWSRPAAAWSSTRGTIWLWLAEAQSTWRVFRGRAAPNPGLPAPAG